ncbi:MAG TPA: NPCBM/NEW2 domain-containing protein [Chthoniobacteraceae bacterium]|nr:NPCBM/NEW2 domain-containing protein [Chthoniobacteraceae bacterium]
MLRSSLLLTALLPASLLAGPNPVMDAAQQRIAAFHAGEKPNGAVLRVVYFHAADREALPEYAARLDRILTDISAFYREGMEWRFDVKTAGLPLGRNDGKLVIHMVRGQHPAAHYQHESGDETWSEVRKALAGKFDPEHEHVLILYGLCERASDGRFVFTAPYYGATWSDHRRGLCHAADCELLDPLLLTQKEKPFVFTEHYYERMEMTVAKFNSWYLGGIAHELGHGLGFPHDNGGPGEAPGIALMGDGNLHYREDQWGGRRPAYLSLATALRFAAHPLVTQSDKARWQTADATFEYLSATAAKGTLRLVGRVRASIPPCALIASAWPATARTDHGAMTFCAAVDDDGKFIIELTNLNGPSWRMNLACLLANGAESLIELPFQCNKNGEPDVSVFSIDQTVDSAEQMLMRDPAQAEKLLTDDAIAAAPTEESRRRLRLLRAMREPEPEPIDLTTTHAARVFLSDARWSKAEVGWGKVARNRYWFIPGRWQGMLLKLHGEVFAKGLYAHSNSEFIFPLGGKWKTFSATIGLRDGATDQGSAIFRVIGDGKELFRSNVLRPGQRETVRVEIPGIQQLELHAKGGEGHNHNSWAIWADPVLEK